MSLQDLTKLKMKWSRRERDFIIDYPNRPDGHLLHVALNSPRWNYDGKSEPSLVEELRCRGYDLTTLRFEVAKVSSTRGETT